MKTNKELLSDLEAIMCDLNDVRDLASTDKDAAMKMHLACFSRALEIQGGNAQVCAMIDTVTAELNATWRLIA